jgi:hypothetical protein
VRALLSEMWILHLKYSGGRYCAIGGHRNCNETTLCYRLWGLCFTKIIIRILSDPSFDKDVLPLRVVQSKSRSRSNWKSLAWIWERCQLEKIIGKIAKVWSTLANFLLNTEICSVFFLDLFKPQPSSKYLICI